MSNNLTRDDMRQPVERLIERDFDANLLLARPENLSGVPKDFVDGVDLLMLDQDALDIHVVQFAKNMQHCLFDLDRGIHSITALDANHHWLVVPLSVMRDDDAIFDDVLRKHCRLRGVGLIGVYPCGKGVAAKILMEAKRHENDVLDTMPGLRKALERRLGEVLEESEQRWRVVSDWSTSMRSKVYASNQLPIS